MDDNQQPALPTHNNMKNPVFSGRRYGTCIVIPGITKPKGKAAGVLLERIKLKSECGRAITVPRRGGSIPGTFGEENPLLGFRLVI